MNTAVRSNHVAPMFTEAPTVNDLVGAVVLPHPRFGMDRPERARRVLNVVIAAVALIVCAPLMVAIAILVAVTSPGPILYTQTRVGVNRRHASSMDGRRRVDYGGRLFKIYKFRTMRVDADKHGEVWAKPRDPRVTVIGRVLRNYRLDELPQLFNILKGDMNFVGPRPEQPKIFANMRREIEYYSERQRVLPGITGLAQIRHHYGSTVDDVRNKLSYDLQYIGRRSWQEDLKVLVQTVPVVIYKKGAW